MWFLGLDGKVPCPGETYINPHASSDPHSLLPHCLRRCSGLLYCGAAVRAGKVWSELLRYGCSSIASHQGWIGRCCARRNLDSLSRHTGWNRSCLSRSISLREPDLEDTDIASVPANRPDPSARRAALPPRARAGLTG